MGAIQQAFNQALNIGALAMSPAIANKKAEKAKIKAETEKTEKAQAKSNEAFDVADKVFGEKGHTEAERELAVKDLYEAQEANYKQNPTKENFELRAQTYEDYQEWVEDTAAEKAAEHAAKKAAKTMALQQQQYKDQSIAALRETVSAAQSQHYGTREAK
jgi:hypothetical protein